MAFDGFDAPGTTPVPDLVFDELLEVLTGNELKALLYIIRRTYGFGKSSDAISLSQFRDGITTKEGKVLDKGCGIKHNRTLLVALDALEQGGYIISEKRHSSAGDKDITIYRLHVKDSQGVVTPGNHGVVTPGNHGSYLRSPRVVTPGNQQETVLPETVLQETGEKEKRARNLQGVSASVIPSQKKLPENVIPLGDVHLSERERAVAEARGREQREAEVWAVVERVLGTTYSRTQRAKAIHTSGMVDILNEPYSDDDLEAALRAMDLLQLKNFNLNNFSGWLPTLLSKRRNQLLRTNNGNAGRGGQPISDDQIVTRTPRPNVHRLDGTGTREEGKREEDRRHA